MKIFETFGIQKVPNWKAENQHELRQGISIRIRKSVVEILRISVKARKVVEIYQKISLLVELPLIPVSIFAYS